MRELVAQKTVYKFGPGQSEGNQKMKNLLGGKGANLAEMSLIGLPVPPGITVTTEMCNLYSSLGKDKLMSAIKEELEEGINHIEQIMGTSFGDASNPCLVSVRSGARASMPGMMDTVLNLGMNDETVEGLAAKTGKPRFAWDSYRRFIQMYADVVMDVNKNSDHGRDAMEAILHNMKLERNAKTDQDLSVEDLKELVTRYKKAVIDLTGEQFPMDPWSQLWGAIMAVFESWFTPRAAYYRKMHNLPEEWGTAVNIQAMVYGNMGTTSGSGVAFTRDAATGEDLFNGEYLLDAQGEDVVAGIRTPMPITLKGSRRWAKRANVLEEVRAEKHMSLEELMPEVYAQLNDSQQKLEDHYKEMQDLEFTIEEGNLWILQTRNGKRTGMAMIKIGMDMLKEGVIDDKTVIQRMDVNKIDELLHPVFAKDAMLENTAICRGLPASPGAATGTIVFTADDAVAKKEAGEDVILVRMETIADDLKGMDAARGVLTARGGMTSHAAVVARGMGKCCVSGAGELEIDYDEKTMSVGTRVIREGEWISLNGTTGEVFVGKLKTQNPVVDDYFRKMMEVADKFAVMKVKTNADTPETAKLARNFGAQGIGLCRTEHMFFEGDRIKSMREMIMASNEKQRRESLADLLPMQRADFKGIFRAMKGLPVTIRLMDPPLHEFVPLEAEQQEELAEELGIPVDEVRLKVEKLEEVNPMLGHRGCRLGITHPEITEMQVRAILEAAIELKEEGIEVEPEIMIPLVGTIEEFLLQHGTIQGEARRVIENSGKYINYKIGTMIETPRAAMIAGEIAKEAEFFSFGTNDLTQMMFGYSRDDAGKFLPEYIKRGILKHDPFQQVDERGVGRMMRYCVHHGRESNEDLVIGICGEHGGDPQSIKFCQSIGLDYVSCSPYRVPIARIAAAQAIIGTGN
ncbi:MAG: pyruvate, phosphate dikinase [Bacteroidetes bacterium]|nr:pyruvate, phosphate dikinase [Bacteroidota bacterium]